MTNVLKETRIKKGLSVAQLAAKSGVTRQTIYNLERDPSRSVKSEIMEALASALGVKVGKIFLM